MFGPINVAASAAAVTVWVLVGSWLRRRRRAAHQSTRDAWIDGAIAGWIVAVLVVTLSPPAGFGRLATAPEIVLVPFERLDGAPAVYAVVNFLLLVPLGGLLALRGSRPRLGLAVGIGLAVSVVVESLQLLHPGRVTNVDDVILNGIGVLVGALLGAGFRPLRRSRTADGPSGHGRGPPPT